jgi:phenylacetate-coenzyme A ligase PaaK-like adenylate-forming protein
MGVRRSPNDPSTLKGETELFLSQDLADFESLHLGMLKREAERGRASPVYDRHMPDVNSWEDLQRLPAIGYDRLDDAFKTHGLERSLLVPADRYYHTSGYTGVSKRVYYSAKDIEDMAHSYALFGYLIGVRKGMTGWSIAGEEPLVSGPTLHNASKVLEADLISTLLAQDTDLRKAVAKASHSERFDVMAGTPLLFYVIGRIAHEEGYFRSMIVRAAKNNYHLPGPLAELAATLMLAGIDLEQLQVNVRAVRIAITYAEPLSPYLGSLKEYYPNMKAYDVLGSTECPLIASQYSPRQKGLQLFLPGVIAELADPREVQRSKKDRTPLHAIPWTEWKAGMTGELIISRPGECLPLLRYATGDQIEVLDPICSTDVMMEEGVRQVISPSIKVMGRSVDTLDFDAQDESGNYLGCKIYSRHIQEALQRSDNVRWWELYDVGGRPSRLVFLIIPERPVDDEEAFRRVVERKLLNECNDLLGTLKMGRDLDRLQILVAKPSAYVHVQAEIDERAEAGRSLGQLKPKHIYRYEDEAEFQERLRGRMA